MTHHKSPDRDIRDVIECLTNRASSPLPRVIEADGTISESQVAVFPQWINVDRFGLPNRELSANPSDWNSSTFEGSREPDYSAYLPKWPFAYPAGFGDSSLWQSASEQDLHDRLIKQTGLAYAQCAIWDVAGWSLQWIGAYLWRLRDEGWSARFFLIVQMSLCAYRQVWMANQDLPAFNAVNDPSPIDRVEKAGACALGISLVQIILVFDALFSDPATIKHLTPLVLDKKADIRCILIGLLQRYVLFVEQANKSVGRKSQSKLDGALKAADSVLKIVALFAVCDGDLAQRIAITARQAPKLPTTDNDKQPGRRKNSSEHSPDNRDMLEQFEDRLSKLGKKLKRSAWPIKYRESLKMFDLDTVSARMAVLRAIPAKLIYKLAVTRRLDRLYVVFPWMAALSPAFPKVFGGPLGALAQLFEVARAREKALGLKTRLRDAADPERFDLKRRKQAYKNATSLAGEVMNGTRPGYRIEELALSNAVAKEWIAGKHFHEKHPIATVARGRINWSIQQAVGDPQTAQTLQMIESDKVFPATKNDTDVPTFAGLTLVQDLGMSISTIFDGRLRGPAFRTRKQELSEAYYHVIGIRLYNADDLVFDRATYQIVESILISIDIQLAVRGTSRLLAGPTTAKQKVGSNLKHLARAVERQRFERMHNVRARKSSEALQDEVERYGGAIRRNASKHEVSIGSPTAAFQEIVDLARTFTSTKFRRPHGPPTAKKVPPKGGVYERICQDEPLERILEGLDQRPGLTPVAHQSLYVLWFKPDIDRPIVEWIAMGAPMISELAFVDPCQAQAISTTVQAVRKRGNIMFAFGPVDRRKSDVVVALFTGFSPLMSDDAHPRVQPQPSKKKAKTV